MVWTVMRLEQMKEIWLLKIIMMMFLVPVTVGMLRQARQEEMDQKQVPMVICPLHIINLKQEIQFMLWMEPIKVIKI